MLVVGMKISASVASVVDETSESRKGRESEFMCQIGNISVNS